MKKTIWLLLAIPFFAFAQWNDCSEGCSYPGDCGSYVDTNGDGLCDHGQPEPKAVVAPTSESVPETILATENSMESGEDGSVHDLISGQELKTKTVEEVAKIYGVETNDLIEALEKEYGIKVNPQDDFQKLHDNHGFEPSVVKEIATNLALGVLEEEKSQGAKIEIAKERVGKKYNFFPLSFLILSLYFLTWLFSWRGKIKKITHRKIWNFVLLITFLLSGVSGVLLIIRINYGWSWAWPFNLLKLHVETGLVMALISLFHLAWHWKYFVLMFRRKKNL